MARDAASHCPREIQTIHKFSQQGNAWLTEMLTEVLILGVPAH